MNRMTHMLPMAHCWPVVQTRLSIRNQALWRERQACRTRDGIYR
jgi:hypothetical protein